MNMELIAFTGRGCLLGMRLQELLAAQGHKARFCFGTGPHKANLKEWTKNAFTEADALVFIGAAGIAVRACAPYVTSKVADPAVVVLDERANWCIPLLSGHIGGANALAIQLAEMLGARAVITTATDANGLWAVDSWATALGISIKNPQKIKKVSSRLLAGQDVLLCSRVALTGKLPEGVSLTDDPACCHVLLSPYAEEAFEALHLVPPVAVLGLGCKKNTPQEKIEAAFLKVLAESRLHPHGIKLVCSIDLKAEEPGVLDFCAAHRYAFETFTAKELAGVPGEFSPSAFVQSVTGVDNVCERSAVLASDGGKLLLKKQSLDGITMALALLEYSADLNG